MISLNRNWHVPLIGSLTLFALERVASWDGCLFLSLLLLSKSLEISPSAVVGLYGDWHIPLIGGFALLALK